MMRNTTLNLPDALIRHAKTYAAQHGTTVTALVREHLERVTGFHRPPTQSDDPLRAFSEGRMAREAAIRALGLRDYAQLLLLLGERALPLPGLPSHQVDAMADALVRLYRESAGR